MKVFLVGMLGGILGAALFGFALESQIVSADGFEKVVTANKFYLTDLKGSTKGLWSIDQDGNPQFYLVQDQTNLDAGYAALFINNNEGTMRLSNSADQDLTLTASYEEPWNKVMSDWVASVIISE